MEKSTRVKGTLPGGNALGFRAAPLGNTFRDIPDKAASATFEAASARGIRYV